MKKRMGIFVALLCCFLLAVNVWADDGCGQKPDYATDYYMIVECAEGGVDIYDGADFSANKLNEELIPNGTALHITGEKTGEDNSHWVYVQHRSMYGYVPSDHLKPVTVGEAAASEYRTYNGVDVEFDVTVRAEGGQVSLSKGPGDQFGKRRQSLENGTIAHITQYVETSPGIAWGKTSVDGVQGWIDLTRDTDYAENKAAISLVEKTGIAAGVTSVPEPTVTPELTVIPEPTVTPEPTAAAEPTITAKPTETLEPTATAEPAAETEASLTEEVKEVSGENAKEENGKNHIIWIIVILVLLAAGLAVFFVRKKNKNL